MLEPQTWRPVSHMCHTGQRLDGPCHGKSAAGGRPVAGHGIDGGGKRQREGMGSESSRRRWRLGGLGQGKGTGAGSSKGPCLVEVGLL